VTQQITDQVVLITGAAGRIGAATAQLLHSLGASLVLNDINSNILSSFAEKLNTKRPGSVFTNHTDITTESGLAHLISSAEQVFPQIHSAIHSAYPRSQGWGTKLENLDELYLFQDLSMQLGGSILFSKIMISHFQKHDGGNLVHISSIQGLSAPKFQHYENTSMYSPIEYSAIKAGIISITKWLAKYCAGQNIRVNCISPGGILSDQPKSFLSAYRASCTNIGMLLPDQVAGSVVHLISPEAEAINGQNLVIDDGWSL